MEPVTLTWGPPYYTKGCSWPRWAAGRRTSPSCTPRRARLARARRAVQEELTPELLARHGIPPLEQFEPAVWKQGWSRGRQYAIPLDTHPVRPLLQHRPRTRRPTCSATTGSCARSAARTRCSTRSAAMKEASGQWGVVTEIRGVSLWRLFLTLTGNRAAAPCSRRAMERSSPWSRTRACARSTSCRKTRRGRKLMPTNLDYPASIANFSQRDDGHHAPGRVGGHHLPGGGDAVRHDAGAQHPRRAGDAGRRPTPSSSRRRAAGPRSASTRRSRFVAGMLESSYTWAQGGGMALRGSPVLDSERYRELTPQSHYASAAEKTVVDPPVWFSGSGSDLENEAWGAFLGVMTGGSKPQAGLDQFRAAMQQFLDKPKPGRRADHGHPQQNPFPPRRCRRARAARVAGQAIASGRAGRSRRRSSSSTSSFLLWPVLAAALTKPAFRLARRRGEPSSAGSATTPRRSADRILGRRCGTRCGSRSSPRPRWSFSRSCWRCSRTASGAGGSSGWCSSPRTFSRRCRRADLGLALQAGLRSA